MSVSCQSSQFLETFEFEKHFDFSLCFTARRSSGLTRSSLERVVRGSNLGPVKSDTMLQRLLTERDISSIEAVLPGRNDAEMGPANSLHASANIASIMKYYVLSEIANDF